MMSATFLKALPLKRSPEEIWQKSSAAGGYELLPCASMVLAVMLPAKNATYCPMAWHPLLSRSGHQQGRELLLRTLTSKMGSKLIKGGTELRIFVAAALLHGREALLWAFSSASAVRCQPHVHSEDYGGRLSNDLCVQYVSRGWLSRELTSASHLRHEFDRVLEKSAHTAHSSILLRRRLTQRQPQASCTRCRCFPQTSCIASFYSDAKTLGTFRTPPCHGTSLASHAAQARHCLEPCRRRADPCLWACSRSPQCMCQGRGGALIAVSKVARAAAGISHKEALLPVCRGQSRALWPQQGVISHHSMAASSMPQGEQISLSVHSVLCNVKGSHAGMGYRLQSTETMRAAALRQ